MKIIILLALLHDIGKLVEYKEENGRFIQSNLGKLVRHPISGLGLRYSQDIPEEVMHILPSFLGGTSLIVLQRQLLFTMLILPTSNNLNKEVILWVKLLEQDISPEIRKHSVAGEIVTVSPWIVILMIIRSDI